MSRRSPIRITALAIALCLACRGKDSAQETASVRGAGGSSATGAAANSTPAAKGACPNTGLWAECSVFDRLDHAGLAPRRDSSAGSVRMTPLTRAGTRLLLGNAELDVFIYPDEASRARDEGRLDMKQFIEAADEPTLRGEPTLIRSSNLLAVLRSRNDHQRERVSDALTAGPPQASKAMPLAPAHSVP